VCALKRVSLFDVVSKTDKTTKKSITTNTQESSCNNTATWRLYPDNKPEIMKPCEFYVDTGSKKKDVFYGYLADRLSLCTDEPYKMIVLRKKFNNLYFRELKDCDLSQCPNGFPCCKDCKRSKHK
jgi:hypothetical protein